MRKGPKAIVDKYGNDCASCDGCVHLLVAVDQAQCDHEAIRGRRVLKLNDVHLAGPLCPYRRAAWARGEIA